MTHITPKTQFAISMIINSIIFASSPTSPDKYHSPTYKVTILTINDTNSSLFIMRPRNGLFLWCMYIANNINVYATSACITVEIVLSHIRVANIATFRNSIINSHQYFLGTYPRKRKPYTCVYRGLYSFLLLL